MYTRSVLTVVVCVLAGFWTGAIADTIQIAYVGVDAGGQESITLNGAAMSGANGVQAMQTKNPVGPLANLIAPNTWAYCYELGASTDFPFNTYSVSTLESIMDFGKASLISQLWAQHYDDTWQASTYIYYGGNQGGWVSGQPADTLENQQALAMNFAIYEIFYDFNGSMTSLDIANGIFKANSAGTNPTAAVSIASGWLSGLVSPGNYTGPKAQLLGLTSSNLQDIIVEVPEPLTLSLLGLGALAMRRKKA